MTIESLQKALARYHAIYDNAAYTHIRCAVISDVVGTDADPTEYETQPAVVDLMNRLIDTCLEACGAAHYAGAHIGLAQIAAQVSLREATITAIHRYLRTFQRTTHDIADDFQAITHTLQQMSILRGTLQSATSTASTVHSWQGRTAYHLLAAASSLITSAEILLIQDDADYLQEKIQHGLAHLGYARAEVVRHAPATFERINLKLSPDGAE